MRKTIALAVALLGAIATPALAQDRPNEDALFGSADAGMPTPPAAEARPSEDSMFGDGKPETPGAQLQPAGTDEPGSIDDERLGGPALTSRFDTAEEKVDPLKVGGTLYWRTFAAYSERQSFKDIALSTPALVDAYFDARPSERVRGMLLARMHYDATSSNQTAPTWVLSLPGYVPPTSVANPSVDLDQLWIRFDIAQRVFVTAGKQHVKWGASRFWNPTDFLSPELKDPLAVFDARLGANMVKLHVPWESKGWNFYAIGLLDNAGAANTLGKVGGAGRAEIVLGQTELGVDAVYVSGRRPRYGFDISSALGPLDVYGELALRSGKDFRPWRLTGEDFNAADPLSSVEQYTPEGIQTLVSGGATFSFNYTENNALTLGAEYFYNPVGTPDAVIYPWLIFQNQFNPFYVARHYAALYALALGLPGGLDNVTMTLSNIGSFSDFSFVTRLDTFVRVLSYLSLEFYGAVHYGIRGGVFRFGFDLPPVALAPGVETPPISVPAPVFELGLGLRVSL